MSDFTRRSALVGAAAVGLGGCARVIPADALAGSHAVRAVLDSVQTWTETAQRFFQAGGALAREYPLSDISPRFKANGTTHPPGEAYARAVADGFSNWTLTIDGLVDRPLSLGIAALRRLPSRTQVTRHDCVEGWSAIGAWTGVQLGLLLTAVRPRPEARYVILHCADTLEGEPEKGGDQAPGQYYESIDLVDAHHPQTMVAFALNGRDLDVPHGAPLRLRVERQLGYKQAKYLTRIELADSFGSLHGGKGGYWEDRGYEWYAGV